MSQARVKGDSTTLTGSSSRSMIFCPCRDMKTLQCTSACCFTAFKNRSVPRPILSLSLPLRSPEPPKSRERAGGRSGFKSRMVRRIRGPAGRVLLLESRRGYGKWISFQLIRTVQLVWTHQNMHTHGDRAIGTYRIATMLMRIQPSNPFICYKSSLISYLIK